MSPSNGKCPDGACIVLWKSGKLLIWDVTCPDTFATLYLHLATNRAEEFTAAAEVYKTSKYCHLDCHFAPIAFETMGVPGPKT